jgi:hypothetical protein
VRSPLAPFRPAAKTTDAGVGQRLAAQFSDDRLVVGNTSFTARAMRNYAHDKGGALIACAAWMCCTSSSDWRRILSGGSWYALAVGVGVLSSTFAMWKEQIDANAALSAHISSVQSTLAAERGRANVAEERNHSLEAELRRKPVPVEVRLGGTRTLNEVPAGAINGSNRIFTLSRTPVDPAQVMLFIDRILLLPETDYSLSGKTITLLPTAFPDTGAPTQGSLLRVYYTVR